MKTDHFQLWLLLFALINPIRFTGKPYCSPLGCKERLNWTDLLVFCWIPFFGSMDKNLDTHLSVTKRCTFAVLQVISAITQPYEVTVYRTVWRTAWEHGVRKPEWPHLVNLLTRIYISMIGNYNLGYRPEYLHEISKVVQVVIDSSFFFQYVFLKTWLCRKTEFTTPQCLFGILII